MPRPKVSERTFYPALMEVIRFRGGQGVQEVQFNSVPDILFELGNHSWLLSVKIGENPAATTQKNCAGLGCIVRLLEQASRSGIIFGISRAALINVF